MGKTNYPELEKLVEKLDHIEGREKAQCDIEKAREIIKNENLYSGKIENKYMDSALEDIRGCL